MSDPAASSVLRLGGRPVPVAGVPLRIDEATPLAFALGPDVAGRLTLAGLPVPLVDGRADAAWVDESRREQWVGELDLELVMSHPVAMVIRPKVVVLPRRAAERDRPRNGASAAGADAGSGGGRAGTGLARKGSFPASAS